MDLHTDEEKKLLVKLPEPPEGWTWRRNPLKRWFELGYHYTSPVSPDSLARIPAWRYVGTLTYEFIRDAKYKEHIDVAAQQLFKTIEDRT